MEIKLGFAISTLIIIGGVKASLGQGLEVTSHYVIHMCLHMWWLPEYSENLSTVPHHISGKLLLSSF